MKASNAVWKYMTRQKTSRGKLWAVGSDGSLQTMWERFTIKKGWARQLLEEAAKSVQLNIDGSWANESPYEERFELLRFGNDLHLEGSSMCEALKPGKAGDRAKFLENSRLGARSSVKLRECYSEVERDRRPGEIFWKIAGSAHGQA